jgi:hypothetical protein
MSLLEPIYIKYENNYATKIDGNEYAKINGCLKIIIDNYDSKIRACILGSGSFYFYRFIGYAKDIDIKGYNGETQESLDSFANHIVTKINKGGYDPRSDGRMIN